MKNLREKTCLLRTADCPFQRYVFSKQVFFVCPEQLHSVRCKKAESNYRPFVFSLDLVTLPETHFFQRDVIAPVRLGVMRLPVLLTCEDAPYQEVSVALGRVAQLKKTIRAISGWHFLPRWMCLPP